MDGTKGKIDKMSMSLDDIIKLEKPNFSKFRRNANFLRNSYNKAKNTLINKGNIGRTFNRNRLGGIVNKRNMINTNIIINKRFDVDSNNKSTFSYGNQITNFPNRLFNRNNTSFNNRFPISITKSNDRQFIINTRNNFVEKSSAIKRNNNERPQFYRNTARTFTRKMFSDNGTFVNRNDGRSFFRNTSTPYNRGAFNQNNDSFVRPFTNKFQGNNREDFNLNFKRRDSFNDNFNRRSSFNNTVNTSIRSYPMSKEIFRRTDNVREVGSQPSRYNQQYRSDGDYRRNDRTQEREYEAMARALIVAHRDSKNVYNPNRGNYNRRVNEYRR